MKSLRNEEGFIDPELQAKVEEAIRHYPNFEAEWWMGGAVAILEVEKWLGLTPPNQE